MNYESQTKGGIFNARVIEEGDVQGTCKLPTSPIVLFQGELQHLGAGGVTDTLPLSHPEVVGQLALFVLLWQENL